VKVLLVNKFYWRSAGAEAVLFETQRLLEEAGHEVAVFAMSDPRNEQTRWAPYFAAPRRYDAGGVRGARDAVASVYSPGARWRLRALLRRFRPDVAHLHNVYHQLTLSVVDELRAHGVPTVMTLHDYKIVCPNYRLLTHDGLCTRCVDGRYYNAVVHRCMQESRAASIVVAVEAYLMRALRQYAKIDLLLSPSRFLGERVACAGYDPARVRIVPNPVEVMPDARRVTAAPGTGRFVYLGRLAPEKGVHVLLEAANRLPREVAVDVVGTGPSAAALARQAEGLPQVTFHGHLRKAQVNRLLDAATAAVLPALWYENCPMAILEAAARGVPSVASRLGGIPELIDDGLSGYLVDPGHVATLADVLARLAADPAPAAAAGERARRRVRERHHPALYLAALEDAYSDVGATRVAAPPSALGASS
jgi:glycosyltransferase involved in cell wall biosynthesis